MLSMLSPTIYKAQFKGYIQHHDTRSNVECQGFYLFFIASRFLAIIMKENFTRLGGVWYKRRTLLKEGDHQRRNVAFQVGESLKRQKRSWPLSFW